MAKCGCVCVWIDRPLAPTNRTNYAKVAPVVNRLALATMCKCLCVDCGALLKANVMTDRIGGEIDTLNHILRGCGFVSNR